MVRIDLGPDEVVLKQDSNVSHDTGRVFANDDGELILTNKALVIVHKKAFGGVKDTRRFLLSEVRVVNGAPQVFAGKGSGGELQLQVNFAHGIEAFELGLSDDDEDEIEVEGPITLSSILTPESEKQKIRQKKRRDKEKGNIAEWCDAISRAVLGMPQAGSFAAETFSFIKESPQTATSAQHANAKCIGCHAPLTGTRGQRMTCPYCDTEQAI